MPGHGRSFRKRNSKFWKYWALPSLIDEIHRIVYVDDIFLNRNAAVLITCSDSCVLGWYKARSENTKTYKTLLSRIAPPDKVVSDSGTGFQTAVRKIWPETKIQRCIFHTFCLIKRYTQHVDLDYRLM